MSRRPAPVTPGPPPPANACANTFSLAMPSTPHERVTSAQSTDGFKAMCRIPPHLRKLCTSSPATFPAAGAVATGAVTFRARNPTKFGEPSRTLARILARSAYFSSCSFYIEAALVWPCLTRRHSCRIRLQHELLNTHMQYICRTSPTLPYRERHGPQYDSTDAAVPDVARPPTEGKVDSGPLYHARRRGVAPLPTREPVLRTSGFVGERHTDIEPPMWLSYCSRLAHIHFSIANRLTN